MFFIYIVTKISYCISNQQALNNMAVCSLYTGNLSDSLGTLEGLVSDNPDLYLQEGILFNLCTLYELESSNAIFRKQKLLSMVSQHKGNGFNVACLKMNWIGTWPVFCLFLNMPPIKCGICRTHGGDELLLLFNY